MRPSLPPCFSLPLVRGVRLEGVSETGLETGEQDTAGKERGPSGGKRKEQAPDEVAPQPLSRGARLGTTGSPQLSVDRREVTLRREPASNLDPTNRAPIE